MTNYAGKMPDSQFVSLISTAPFASGSAREVFDVPSDPSVVIKRGRNIYPGSNMVEWIIWSAIKTSPLAATFGECRSISETGQYLMMERLDDLAQSDLADIPRIPVWTNDRKPNAFGKAGGRIKLRDYGMVYLPDLLRLDCEPAAIQITALNNRQRGLPGW